MGVIYRCPYQVCDLDMKERVGRRRRSALRSVAVLDSPWSSPTPVPHTSSHWRSCVTFEEGEMPGYLIPSSNTHTRLFLKCGRPERAALDKLLTFLSGLVFFKVWLASLLPWGFLTLYCQHSNGRIPPYPLTLGSMDIEHRCWVDGRTGEAPLW